METRNSSHSTDTSGNNTSIFADSPYTTVEIVIIILVAGSLSLVTVVGNILVMLSIKVGASLLVYQHWYVTNGPGSVFFNLIFFIEKIPLHITNQKYNKMTLFSIIKKMQSLQLFNITKYESWETCLDANKVDILGGIEENTQWNIVLFFSDQLSKIG